MERIEKPMYLALFLSLIWVFLVLALRGPFGPLYICIDVTSLTYIYMPFVSTNLIIIEN